LNQQKYEEIKQQKINKDGWGSTQSLLVQPKSVSIEDLQKEDFKDMKKEELKQQQESYDSNIKKKSEKTMEYK